MRSVSEALGTFLAGSSRAIWRHLITITLADSTVVRWTDHEADITVGGNTWTAGGTGTAPLIQFVSRRDPMGTEIGECALTLLCGETAELAGVRLPLAVINDALDRAKVKIERVYGADAIDTSLGTLHLFEGVVAETDPTSTTVGLKLVDPRDTLNIELPRTTIQPPCTAMLYDGQCSLNVGDWTVDGYSLAGSDGRFVSTTRSEADGYFDTGVLTFRTSTTTVALRGFRAAIRSYKLVDGDGVFELDGLPAVPVEGDHFDAYPGCDKRMATCVDRFDNLVHFRGFPLLPPDSSTERIRNVWNGDEFGWVPTKTIPYPNRFSGIQTPTSPPGTVLPLVYGRARIPGTPVYRYRFSANQAGNLVVDAFCEGPIVGARRAWVGDTYTPYVWAGGTTGSVFRVGTRPTQDAWDRITTEDPDYAGVTYPGVAYWGAARWTPTGSPEIAEVEVDGFLSAETDSGDEGDAHPASIIADSTYGLLPSSVVGAGFTWPIETDIGPDGTSASSARQYLTASGLRLSPVIDSRRRAIDILDEILGSCNCSCRMSDGTLEIIPLGDVEFTANGVTYSPDTTTQYDLTEEHFLTGGSEDPVAVSRPARETVVNIVPVEFRQRAVAAGVDPSHAYATRCVEDPEPVDVSRNGPKRSDSVALPMICLSDAALTMSRIRAQTSVKRRNEYTFKLHALNFGLLEPLDYVSLTDSRFGLSERIVRIKAIDEDDSGVLTVTAYDAPLGMSHAVAHTVQSSESGFVGVPWVSSDQRAHETAVRNMTFRGASAWASRSLYSTTWSGTRFVSVGGSSVAATIDGITWDAKADLPAGSSWNAITSDADSLFVAVGSDNQIATSTDLATWTPRTAPTVDKDYGSVLHNGHGKYVAGYNDGIAHSTGGTAWNTATISGGTVLNPTFAWSEGLSLWVAVGSSGDAAYSANGSSWTFVAGPAAMYAGYSSGITGMAWNGSQFVGGGFITTLGVGSAAVALTSMDGIAWSLVYLPPLGVEDAVQAIVYTGQILVAGGMSDGKAAMWTSRDGVHWTGFRDGTLRTDANYGWKSLSWSGHMLVSTSYGGASGITAFASSLVV